MPAIPALRISIWHRAAEAPVLMPRLHWMSAVEVTARGGWQDHRHEHYEIIACTGGTYHGQVNGVAVSLSAGEMLLLAPGDWHADVLRPPCTYLACNIEVPGAGRSSIAILAATATSEQRVLRQPTTAMIAARDRLHAACASGAHTLVQDAALSHFWWLVVAALPASALRPGFAPRADDADFRQRLAVIFARVHAHPPGVPALAKALGLSVAACTAQCRAATGLTPAKALARYRLEQAMEHLQQGASSVAQVAAELGYASPFHFSRAFKQQFGVAPSRC